MSSGLRLHSVAINSPANHFLATSCQDVLIRSFPMRRLAERCGSQSHSTAAIENRREMTGPILAERRLSCSLFVTSGFVKYSHFGFLPSSGLPELVAMLDATIGAYGAMHVALQACDDAALPDELCPSKRDLEDGIARLARTIASPYGSTDHRVLAAECQQAFFSYPIVNDRTRDPFVIGRTKVLGGESLKVFHQRLHDDGDRYRWRMKDPATV